MNCDEVEELIGAYALGALPVETLADIGEHLVSCENHPETADLKAVAASLAFAAPEREPPPALKSRLMAAVRGEPAETAAAERGGFFDRLRRWRASPALSYGLAGALAVAVAALVITNAGESDEEQPTTVVLAGANNAQGVIHVVEDDLIVMEADGLEPLDPEETYQVWAIASGRPVSLGLLGPVSEGQVEQAMRADLTGADAVAVTIEPAGGSLTPTGDRVLESDEIAIP